MGRLFGRIVMTDLAAKTFILMSVVRPPFRFPSHWFKISLARVMNPEMTDDEIKKEFFDKGNAKFGDTLRTFSDPRIGAFREISKGKYIYENIVTRGMLRKFKEIYKEKKDIGRFLKSKEKMNEKRQDKSSQKSRRKENNLQARRAEY